LEELTKITEFKKPQLSYHIYGTPEVAGLKELGFMDLEKHEQGKMRVTLSTIGKMFLDSHS